MSTRTRTWITCVATLVFASSCGGNGGRPDDVGPVLDSCPQPARVIQGDDIFAAGGTWASDGIRLLRIPWHRNPEVHLDGSRSGRDETLRNVHYTEVREMYYLDSTAPAACPGSGQMDGVIVVRTHRS